MTDPKLRRRYVYMSDAEWEWLKGQAGLDATISAVVRSLVGNARSPGKMAVPVHAEMAVKESHMDGDVRVIDRAELVGVSVSGRDFRPAPKPEPRKRR